MALSRSGNVGGLVPVLATMLLGAAGGGTAWFWQQPPLARIDSAPRPTPAASDALLKTVKLPPCLYDPASHAPAEFTIRVVNPTRETVRFSDVRTSCGCSGAKLDRMELGPGDATSLRVSINVHGVSGMRSVAVYLMPQTGPRWEYRLRLPTHPRIAFAPPESLLGVLDPGLSVQREIFVETYAPTGQEPSEVTNVRSDQAALAVSVGDSTRTTLETGVVQRRTRVLLAATTTSDTGAFHAEVIAQAGESTTEGASVAAKHRVQWTVRSHYRIVPPRVVLVREADTPPAVEKRLVVQRPDGGPAVIQSARALHSAVTCRLAETQGTATEILVSIDVGQLDQSLWTELELKTGDPAEPLLKIPVAVLLPRR